MKPLALVVVALSSLAAYDTQAQFPNFPAADRVVGAPDFTTAGSTAATPSTMHFSPGVAVDPVSGKFFVSSNGLHRVMRFGAAASLADLTADLCRIARRFLLDYVRTRRGAGWQGDP